VNKALIPILLATAGLAATATPVKAHGRRHREVTHGHFETLPGGHDLGFDIHGRATMVRTGRDGGTTSVVVRVRGLAPNTTYKTHVHNAPCSATPAGGGHYQHEIGGAVDDENEIWPTLTTNSRGRAVGRAVHGEWARDDAQSIVIHWSENTATRLACVDLT
jgi:Cu-Zn family superoxide dismutase